MGKGGGGGMKGERCDKVNIERLFFACNLASKPAEAQQRKSRGGGGWISHLMRWIGFFAMRKEWKVRRRGKKTIYRQLLLHSKRICGQR